MRMAADPFGIGLRRHHAFTRPGDVDPTLVGGAVSPLSGGGLVGGAFFLGQLP